MLGLEHRAWHRVCSCFLFSGLPCNIVRCYRFDPLSGILGPPERRQSRPPSIPLALCVLLRPRKLHRKRRYHFISSELLQGLQLMHLWTGSYHFVGDGVSRIFDPCGLEHQEPTCLDICSVRCCQYLCILCPPSTFERFY